MRKGKDPDPNPDPFFSLMDPDPGGLKTCGSGGSGSLKLSQTGMKSLNKTSYWHNCSEFVLLAGRFNAEKCCPSLNMQQQMLALAEFTSFFLLCAFFYLSSGF
jgi:hypothetical protein